MTDVTIAGLLLEQFAQLLSFLSKKVQTSFLYYSTCFGGGINLVTPYFNQPHKILLDRQALPFVVSLQATTEAAAHGSNVRTDTFFQSDPVNQYVLCPDQHTCPKALRQIKVTVDFVNFFKGLKELFVPVKGKMPPPLLGDPWRYVLGFVSPLGKFGASDTPLIRFVGSDFFQARELGQAVMTLTEVRKRGAEYAALRRRVGDYGRVSIIVNNKKALLVYPHTIKTTLEITETMPTIVSMNPEAAAHFFTDVEALNFSLGTVVTGFLGNVQGLSADAPVKIFVIKTIKCLDENTNMQSEFSDVVIARTAVSCVAAVGKVWFKCDGKYFTGTISSNESSLVFFPITQRRYHVNIAALLERYAYTPVKMRQAGKLIAPWQIEPRKQAEKIAKSLRIKVFEVSQIVENASVAG